jgi:hypothetical protein
MLVSSFLSLAFATAAVDANANIADEISQLAPLRESQKSKVKSQKSSIVTN